MKLIEEIKPHDHLNETEKEQELTQENCGQNIENELSVENEEKVENLSTTKEAFENDIKIIDSVEGQKSEEAITNDGLDLLDNSVKKDLIEEGNFKEANHKINETLKQVNAGNLVEKQNYNIEEQEENAIYLDILPKFQQMELEIKGNCEILEKILLDETETTKQLQLELLKDLKEIREKMRGQCLIITNILKHNCIEKQEAPLLEKKSQANDEIFAEGLQNEKQNSDEISKAQEQINLLTQEIEKSLLNELENVETSEEFQDADTLAENSDDSERENKNGKEPLVEEDNNQIEESEKLKETEPTNTIHEEIKDEIIEKQENEERVEESIQKNAAAQENLLDGVEKVKLDVQDEIQNLTEYDKLFKQIEEEKSFALEQSRKSELKRKEKQKSRTSSKNSSKSSTKTKSPNFSRENSYSS